MRALIFVVAALVVLAAACSSDRSDGLTADSTPNPEVPVGTATEGPPEASDALRREIADTLEGFYEAFFNADPLKLATYWSEECALEDTASLDATLVFFADLFGGQAGVLIDVDKLIVEELDDGRVRAPADQPEGTLELLVGGQLFPDVDAGALGTEVVFVPEDGVWRVTECAQFAGLSG